MCCKKRIAKTLFHIAKIFGPVAGYSSLRSGCKTAIHFIVLTRTLTPYPQGLEREFNISIVHQTHTASSVG